MLSYIRDLHLERIINLMMIIQCIGIAWMTFLYARGDMFPAAVLQVINGCIFISRYGKFEDCFKTKLSKCFTIFIFIEILSFSNYLFDSSKDTQMLGGLFYHANLFEFFCYSIVWYVNYIFFYIYTKKNDSVELLKLFAILFFIVGVLNNYRAYVEFRVKTGNMMQINYFYHALMPLPFLFFFINNRLKYIFLLITLACVISGFKRSGIFACCLIFLANFFIDSAYSIKKLLYNSIIVIIFVWGSSIYLGNNKAIERTQTRLERLESDGGSGRTHNIENTFDRFLEAPTINQIFGFGFMGHAAKYKEMVDVELVAILYYYGIIGWIIYLFIHCVILSRIWHIFKKRDTINSSILCSYFSCYIILMFYSIAAEPFSYHFFFVLIFVFWGFIEALLYKKYLLV